MSSSAVKYLIKKSKLLFAAAFVLTIMTAMLAASTGGAEQTDEGQGVYLPIIMYHSFLKDKSLQNDYTISPDILEADLKYFSENGYTTVTVSDLIDYVYNNSALPEKCVMLTFDDGYYNNYYYAYPLLLEYNFKAVISPIAAMSEAFTETTDISVTYGHISANEINEMISSGLVEIQNHSYDMHSLTPRKGASRKSGESYEDYKRLLIDDINKAQSFLTEYTDAEPVCYVYPFGAESDETLDIIKECGFLCTLTCTEKPNIINRDADSLYELGRYRRSSSESISALMSRIEADI